MKKPLITVLVAAVASLMAGCASAAGATVASHRAVLASMPAGPSAAQLAHGHWVRMADPPIRLCQPTVTWDGSALIVIESGVAPCHRAAAAYNPATNHWAKMAAPPRAVGLYPLAAWGDGRLVLVSRRTGFAAAWSPLARRWVGAPRVPAAAVLSLTWTGRRFLAITARPGQVTGRAWRLEGSRWRALPALPPVWHGWYAGAPAAVAGGYVYVLAHELHGKLGGNNISGSSRLLRLTAAGWKAVPLPSAAAQGWTYALAAVDGRLLATGTGCAVPVCLEEVGRAAMITPGSRAGATLLSPPGGLGIPFTQGIVAGPHVIVVTYSVGGNRLYGGAHFRAVEIYNPRDGRWLTGPRAPASPPDRAAYWTPNGVVSLGQGGGWVLRPAG